LDKLKVGTHYYNHQINKKIAEIKRECGVGSSVDGDQAAAEMFYSLDMNHDGTIAREELMIIYPDTVILAEEYTHFDQNGDGTIVEEEFVEAY
jgi:Ca2+-binding EF-hand superfamily protein